MLFLEEEGIKKFECLHTLTIGLLYNPYPYQLSDLDTEFLLVQRWGSFSPTLTVCTLLSAWLTAFFILLFTFYLDTLTEHGSIGNTRWTRFRDNYWFPIVEFTPDVRQSVKTRWFLRAFLLGIYPRELFSEISGGVDMDAFIEMMPPDLFSEVLTEEEEVDTEEEDDNEEDDEDEEDEDDDDGDGDDGGDDEEEEEEEDEDEVDEVDDGIEWDESGWTV